MRLASRIAVVTGAAGGIGAAIATLFAEHGATVVVADRNLAGAETTVGQIVASGGAATAADVDVTDIDAARRLIDDAVDRHGRIDVLANVAGIGSFAHFNDVTRDEFDRVMQVNVNGTFYCAQAAAQHMVK